MNHDRPHEHADEYRRSAGQGINQKAEYQSKLIGTKFGEIDSAKDSYRHSNDRAEADQDNRADYRVCDSAAGFANRFRRVHQEAKAQPADTAPKDVSNNEEQ